MFAEQIEIFLGLIELYLQKTGVLQYVNSFSPFRKRSYF